MIQTLTVGQVAEMLHASPDTVRRKVRNGKIPMVKHGKEYIVLAHHFEEWLKSTYAGNKKKRCHSLEKAKRGTSTYMQTADEYAEAVKPA